MLRAYLQRWRDWRRRRRVNRLRRDIQRLDERWDAHRELDEQWSERLYLDDPRLCCDYSSDTLLHEFRTGSTREFCEAARFRIRLSWGHSLLGLIFKALLDDHAIALHVFEDKADDCVRMQFCKPAKDTWPVPLWTPPDIGDEPPKTDDAKMGSDSHTAGPPSPACEEWEPLDRADPQYGRAWYEFQPAPRFVAKRFIELLHRYTRPASEDSAGSLPICYGGNTFSASVHWASPTDVRFYFTDERPPIRPKLASHFEELGLCPPDWAVSAKPPADSMTEELTQFFTDALAL